MIRHGEPPYLECSSKGDKRFSAFFAHVRLVGTTIEKAYQAKKIFEDGSSGLDPTRAKGRKAVNQEQCAKYYSHLWDLYFFENPQLLQYLLLYNGFSDMFGQRGHCCQATEIYRIVSAHRC